MLLNAGRKNILNGVCSKGCQAMDKLVCYYGYDDSGKAVSVNDSVSFPTYLKNSINISDTLTDTTSMISTINEDSKTIKYTIQIKLTDSAELINTIALGYEDGNNKTIFTRILFYELTGPAIYKLTYTLYF